MADMQDFHTWMLENKLVFFFIIIVVLETHWGL